MGPGLVCDVGAGFFPFLRHVGRIKRLVEFGGAIGEALWQLLVEIGPLLVWWFLLP